MRITMLLLVLLLAAVILTGCAIGPRAEASIHVLSPHDNSITAGSHNTATAPEPVDAGFWDSDMGAGLMGLFFGGFLVFVLFLFGAIEVVS